MRKFFERMYHSIICYDPIIEELDDLQIQDDREDQHIKCYLASPIQPNRKQRRSFKFDSDEVKVSAGNN